MIWRDADAYCVRLSSGGRSAGRWRLPTISELRTLIRGCPATMTGGECAAADACLSERCWSETCLGCATRGGPGVGGCYWDPALGGNCLGYGYWYWSSSLKGWEGSPWYVSFTYGYVHFGSRYTAANVRCVRSGS
jgi:hypothetical protein